MKMFAFILLTIPGLCFAQSVASPNLLASMLKGAQVNITKFCGKGNTLEFTQSPEAHDTFVSNTVDGRRRTIFAPKLTGLAVCRASNGVILIQWTAHSDHDLNGELKLSVVTKSFFSSTKLSPVKN